MSYNNVLLLLEKCQTNCDNVRDYCKTKPYGTYYSEPKKMNNLDTSLIETALLANK